jgi:glycosyltransferase involved in cell wall biosynthesis
VVSYHYPPDPAVGSLRARNVAQAFAAEGHEVFVVSVARPDAPARDQDGKVTVVRVVPTASPRSALAALNKLLTRRKSRVDVPVRAGSAPATAVAWKGPERISTIKRWAGAIAWLPDDAQGFVVPASGAVAKLMLGDGRDVLYTTAPPFSGHLVGLLTRLRRRFTWFIEYRDPWTDNVHKPWFVRSMLTDALERWLERRCIALSDGVVPVSAVFADLLAARFGAKVTDKMLLVRNGIPTAINRAPPSDPDQFRIVYAGSFYIRRDPRGFFKALSAIRVRGKSLRRLDVQLVGDCRYFEGEPLAPEIERLGLADVVTFVDWLPHKESVALISSADLLLLLAQDQALSVPNKVYEYLGTGKPILALADRDGETARVLREVGGQFIISEDAPPDALEIAIADALARPASNETPLSPALAPLKTVNQMAMLTRWVEEVYRAGRAR